MEPMLSKSSIRHSLEVTDFSIAWILIPARDPNSRYPDVVESGKTTRVTIYGRNLSTRLPPSLISGAGFSNVASSTVAQQSLDSVEIEVTPPLNPTLTPLPLAASQAVVQAFPLQLRNGNRPVLLTTTDLAVVTGGPYNQTSRQAQLITVPCEISGWSEAR